MILTYKYRLLPTRSQHHALNNILEEQRQLYNAALAERIDAYQRSLLEVERGLRSKPHAITYFDQTNSLTKIRNDYLTSDEFSRLPALLQHWTLKRLDDAYNAFFRRTKANHLKPGFPRFRGHLYWHSFGSTVQGGNSPISFDGHRVRLASRTWNLLVRAHIHRPLPGDAKLKAVVFSRAASGRKWNVSLQCEMPESVIRRCQSTQAAIGIDLGVINAIVQSDPVIVPAAKPGKRMRKAVRRAQRMIARSKRGSKRRRKSIRRLQTLHEKQTAIRREWQHKQAARLTRSYALIAIEDLQVKNMTRAAKGTVEQPGKNVRAKAGLNRSILDIGWSGFRSKLEYKAFRDGSRLALVNPAYTSQDCNGCGARVPKSLALREHSCPDCGLVLDRDTNAAKNILALALTSDEYRGWPVPAVLNGGSARREPGNTVATKATGRRRKPGTPSHTATARKPSRNLLISRISDDGPSR